MEYVFRIPDAKAKVISSSSHLVSTKSRDRFGLQAAKLSLTTDYQPSDSIPLETTHNMWVEDPPFLIKDVELYTQFHETC